MCEPCASGGPSGAESSTVRSSSARPTTENGDGSTPLLLVCIAAGFSPAADVDGRLDGAHSSHGRVWGGGDMDG